eukprot:scaffold80681_cov66-Phaeocystis_antarctica.AAC.6
MPASAASIFRSKQRPHAGCFSRDEKAQKGNETCRRGGEAKRWRWWRAIATAHSPLRVDACGQAATRRRGRGPRTSRCRRAAQQVRGGREWRRWTEQISLFFFHCRRVVCAVLSRLFGTVSLCNKLQTQKKKGTREGQEESPGEGW